MEYLLELRSQEIPVRLLRGAVGRLARRLVADLTACGLAPAAHETGVSQRRMVFWARGLPEREPDREERELGPPADEAWQGGTPDGAPTEALEGFAERLGATAGELVAVATEKGEYAAHIRHVEGRGLAAVLAEIVPVALRELRWHGPILPWPEPDAVWPRPLTGLLSIAGGEVVPFELDGHRAGRTSAGHPLLYPEEFEVESREDHRQELAARGIEVSFEKRRPRLAALLREHAEMLGGEPWEAPELVDRLALANESLGVVAGRIPAEYLALPVEVVAATLMHQQSAVPLVAAGEILPRFLAVMDRVDDPEGQVREGQEWAAAGHLADARFDYERDRRSSLASRARELEQLVFHPRLGDYGAKSRRVAALVATVARELEREADLEAAREAAQLAKADLTTAMVRHGPGLRGKMGGIYAREEGYIEAVWQAIYDQYQPLGLDDALPRGGVGELLAVADRLDTLVGFFGAGLVPTGSKDPHGLRRLAQGLLRLLLEAGIALDLDLVAARAVLLYGDDEAGLEERFFERGAEEIVTALQSFLGERLRHLLERRGYALDVIEAARAVGQKDLPDLAARVEALTWARGEDGFGELVLAARRIFNIVHGAPEHELKPELLVEAAEKDLYAALVDVRRDVGQAVDRGEYGLGLSHMAGLVEPLERFFNDVLVMDENEERRHNRMALLQSTRRVFWRIARLKEIKTEIKTAAAAAPVQGKEK